MNDNDAVEIVIRIMPGGLACGLITLLGGALVVSELSVRLDSCRMASSSAISLCSSSLLNCKLASANPAWLILVNHKQCVALVAKMR